MRSSISGKTACCLAVLALCLLRPAAAYAAGEAGISLDKTSVEITAGGTATLTATVTLPDGADKSVTWTTNKADVATVSGGAVTAVSAGTADITASCAGGAYSAVCKVTVKPAAIESSLYTVDRTAGLLKGVSKYTPPSALISGLGNVSADLCVYGKDGKAFSGGAVGTGMTVALTVNGTPLDSLKIVVSGDANGDGAISVSDYTLARLDILGTKKLSGEYFSAADVNGDGAVTITDYTLMRLDILGIKPIGTGVEMPDVTDPRVKRLLEFALTLRGKPYVWGAEGPDTFDCSGFVHYCLNETGYAVGRTTAEGYSKYTKWPLVPVDSLRPGDLLFFYSTDHPGTIGHIAIYFGNGSIIHASSSFGCVVVSPLSDWYKANLSHARRVFN